MIKQSDNLIYGRNPVKEALRANRVLKVYLSNAFADKTILELIADKHIQVILNGDILGDSVVFPVVLVPGEAVQQIQILGRPLKMPVPLHHFRRNITGQHITEVRLPSLSQ